MLLVFIYLAEFSVTPGYFWICEADFYKLFPMPNQQLHCTDALFNLIVNCLCYVELLNEKWIAFAELEYFSSVYDSRVALQKPNIWSKKNAGVLERAQNDLEQKTEETDAMEKARQVIPITSYLALRCVFFREYF